MSQNENFSAVFHFCLGPYMLKFKKIYSFEEKGGSVLRIRILSFSFSFPQMEFIFDFRNKYMGVKITIILLKYFNHENIIRY